MAPNWPHIIWLHYITSILHGIPWELPIRWDLLSQAQRIVDPLLPSGSQIFGLAPERVRLVAMGLQDKVVKTLEGAPSTRAAYLFRWGMFQPGCEGHKVNPLTSTACDILQFLQEQLDAGKFHSTIRGMEAAIKAARVRDYTFIRALW